MNYGSNFTDISRRYRRLSRLRPRFFMSFILMYIIGEVHPVEKYKARHLTIAISYIFGHITYGATVLAASELMKIDYGIKNVIG